MAHNNPPQQFKPLSYLPLVRSVSEQQLADLRKLRRDLNSARATPHVFDDATIERVIRVHTQTLEFVPYTLRQLDHWDAAQPSASDRATIQSVRVETTEIEQLVREVLALAQEIKAGTIDQILAMDEFELGWAALAKTLPNKAAQAAARLDLQTDADPEHLAVQIEARVNTLAAANLGDRAIFEAMADHMPAIKRLLNDDKLLDLCRRLPGLDRYVGIVEAEMLKMMSAAKEQLAQRRNA